MPGETSSRVAGPGVGSGASIRPRGWGRRATRPQCRPGVGRWRSPRGGEGDEGEGGPPSSSEAPGGSRGGRRQRRRATGEMGRRRRPCMPRAFRAGLHSPPPSGPPPSGSAGPLNEVRRAEGALPSPIQHPARPPRLCQPRGRRWGLESRLERSAEGPEGVGGLGVQRPPLPGAPLPPPLRGGLTAPGPACPPPPPAPALNPERAPWVAPAVPLTPYLPAATG